jgi:hypothetical protein
MARRSREGKTVHRTPGAGKARADPVDGLRGQETLAASHAGIDYGSTMSYGEDARPWVGQPDR